MLGDAAEVDAVIDELESVCSQWGKFVHGFEGCEKFTNMIGSMAALWAYCRHQEKIRPDISRVRLARRDTLQAVKESSPLCDMARAMTGYEVTKQVMARAKEIAATGLEYELVSQRFIAATDNFENAFGKAFDNFDDWLLTGNSGQPMDLHGMRVALGHMHNYSCEVQSCSSRWSSAALQEHKSDCLDGAENVLRLACIANHFMILEMYYVLMPRAIAPGEDAALDAATEVEERSDTHTCAKEEEPDATAEYMGQLLPVAPPRSVNIGVKYLKAIGEHRDIMIEFGSKLQSVLTAITMAMKTLSERIGESILQSMGGGGRPPQ